MDASDLKFFEAVARLGGMNRAAAELNTVQSNVTSRIQERLGDARAGASIPGPDQAAREPASERFDRTTLFRFRIPGSAASCDG